MLTYADLAAVVARFAGALTELGVRHGDSSCDFKLYDPATGTELDFATATRGRSSDVTLDSSGRKTVYLHLVSCGVAVSAAR